MAITNFAHENEVGAVRHEEKASHLLNGVHVYYLKTWAVGKVLFLREMNGYDDSDFYATYWDDEQAKPVEVMYASTRGWTYPCGAYVDATSEVWTSYKAYVEHQNRMSRAFDLRSVRKEMMSYSKKYGFETYIPLYRLMKKLSPDHRMGVRYLLKTNLRSGFKKSLRDQLIAWLKQEKPVYETPFSKKQLACLASIEPKESTRYMTPTQSYYHSMFRNQDARLGF